MKRAEARLRAFSRIRDLKGVISRFLVNPTQKNRVEALAAADELPGAIDTYVKLCRN